jgi:NADPH2:quinone reductase
MASVSRMGMRARIAEFAEDPVEGVERGLTIEDQPYPDTDSLTPQDVVVAVKSSAVGWVDLIMTSGQYQHMPRLPYTPGLEYRGVVDWIGDEV